MYLESHLTNQSIAVALVYIFYPLKLSPRFMLVIVFFDNQLLGKISAEHRCHHIDLRITKIDLLQLKDDKKHLSQSL